MKLPQVFVAELDAKRAELARQRAELARVGRRVELLEAEIAGWEGAAKLLAAASNATPPFDGTQQSYPAQANGERRAIRKQWRDILIASARFYPDFMSLDDFERIAGLLGTPTTRNTLRSQMSNYKSLGLMETVGYGRFRLTSKGAREIGVALPDSPATEMPQPADPMPDLLREAAPVGDNTHHEGGKDV